MTWVKGGLTMIKNYFSVGEANHINNMNKEAQNVQLGSAVRTALMGDIGWKDDERYYVDGINGLDTQANDQGKSIDKAFKTIQYAANVARLVPGTASVATNKDRRKYIFIMPGQYNERVTCVGNNISFIGLGQKSGGNYGVIINFNNAIAATAVVSLTGEGLQLINLTISCNQAIPIVLINATSRGILISGCWIKGIVAKTPTIGISCKMDDSVIEDNVIFGCATGIDVAAAAQFTNVIVRRNKLTTVTDGIALANTCVPDNSEISENKVVGSTSSIVNGENTDVIITDNMVKPVETDAGSTSGNNTTLA